MSASPILVAAGTFDLHQLLQPAVPQRRLGVLLRRVWRRRDVRLEPHDVIEGGRQILPSLVGPQHTADDQIEPALAVGHDGGQSSRGSLPVAIIRLSRSARWPTCFAQRESSIIVAAAW